MGFLTEGSLCFRIKCRVQGLQKRRGCGLKAGRMGVGGDTMGS